ncbi:MAG: ankyrin repeat domain-containing protein [Puniceicoccales bacterium]|jgi:hypothetical protein|nr:ankyrin repeat domain-containing protein [Puniceicoccales bacterium]
MEKVNVFKNKSLKSIAFGSLLLGSFAFSPKSFSSIYLNDGNYCFQLCSAVQYDDIDKVASLLNKNSKSNIVDRHGNTPLHYAKSPEMVELLCRAGADVNAQNGDGNTPLHCVVIVVSPSLLVVEKLLQNNADPDIVNKDNYSPRSIVEGAVKYGCIECSETDNHVMIPSLREKIQNNHQKILNLINQYKLNPLLRKAQIFKDYRFGAQRSLPISLANGGYNHEEKAFPINKQGAISQAFMSRGGDQQIGTQRSGPMSLANEGCDDEEKAFPINKQGATSQAFTSKDGDLPMSSENESCDDEEEASSTEASSAIEQGAISRTLTSMGGDQQIGTQRSLPMSLANGGYNDEEKAFPTIDQGDISRTLTSMGGDQQIGTRRLGTQQSGTQRSRPMSLANEGYDDEGGAFSTIEQGAISRTLTSMGGDQQIGTRRSGTQQSGTQRLGTQQSGTRRSRPMSLANEGYDDEGEAFPTIEQGAISRTFGDRRLGTQQSGTRRLGTQQSRTRRLGTQQSGTRRLGTQQSRTRRLGTQQSETRRSRPMSLANEGYDDEGGAFPTIEQGAISRALTSMGGDQQIGTQRSGTRRLGTQQSGTRRSRPMSLANEGYDDEGGAFPTVEQGAISRALTNQQIGTQRSGTRRLGTQQSGTRQSGTQQSGTQQFRTKRSLLVSSKNKDQVGSVITRNTHEKPSNTCESGSSDTHESDSSTEW